MFREWIREHQFELKVMAIGLVVSVAIELALTGSIQDALARQGRK